MAARARLLGDTTTSAPGTWSFGADPEEIHAVVILHAKSDPARERLIETHLTELSAHGGTRVALERTAPWRQGEPFGFADGLSQPFIEGQPALEGEPGKPKPGQTSVPTGEILLGHENAYGELPASPRLGDVDLGANGSYLVWRKLEQDVAGFWSYFAAQGRALAGQGGLPADPGLCREWLAARAMGRWVGGASTVTSPDVDDPTWGATRPDRVNAFGYLEHDADGRRCPIGSHVRRANPRDARGGSVASSELVVRRHRILRRGRAYGVADARDRALLGEPTGDCGLYFVCLQSSIARGFEFIQQTWLANPGFHGVHDEVDPIVGGCEAAGRFTIPLDPVRLRLADLPRFVTTRGGGYFFLPGKHALRALARA